MKPRPLIVTWSVYIERLDRVFEPAVESTRPYSTSGTEHSDAGMSRILRGVDVK